MVDVCLRLANVSKFSLSSQDKNFNIYLRNFHLKVTNYPCNKDHVSIVVTLTTIRTFVFLFMAICLRLANVSKFSLSSQDKNFNIYLRNFHQKVKTSPCAKDYASTVVTLTTIRTFVFLNGGCLHKVRLG